MAVLAVCMETHGWVDFLHLFCGPITSVGWLVPLGISSRFLHLLGKKKTNSSTHTNTHTKPLTVELKL